MQAEIQRRRKADLDPYYSRPSRTHSAMIFVACAVAGLIVILLAVT
jgi:hypothetical protein